MTDASRRAPGGPQGLDALFREAVAAIDAGERATLEVLLTDHPELVRERLDAPGDWLRGKIGGALDGFFRSPYLLWFVAEDPVRSGRLPDNIASMARTIIEAARRERVESLQEQIDYALSLVSWSGVASECGVQIALLDVLVDAGAALERNPENALVNGHFEAAEHLIARGAPLSLGTALCLDRWDDVERLAPVASREETRFALVLAALNGRAEGVRRMIACGVDVNAPSEHLYAHGTPLHHAVSSGVLDAVRPLVEAGADRGAVDTAWNGTPLGWAEHYVAELEGDERQARYLEIAAYLRVGSAT